MTAGERHDPNAGGSLQAARDTAHPTKILNTEVAGSSSQRRVMLDQMIAHRIGPPLCSGRPAPVAASVPYPSRRVPPAPRRRKSRLPSPTPRPSPGLMLRLGLLGSLWLRPHRPAPPTAFRLALAPQLQAPFALIPNDPPPAVDQTPRGVPTRTRALGRISYSVRGASAICPGACGSIHRISAISAAACTCSGQVSRSRKTSATTR